MNTERILPRLGLLLVLGYTAVVGAQLIAARGPYPLYGDERHISGTAWRMVDEGTLRPGFYRYGSFPMYLTAATMGLTAQLARAGGALESLDDVKSAGFPFYAPAFVTQAPRLLFLLLALAGMVCAGLCAQRAFGRAELLALAPAALCCSDWYHRQSWSYLNVDILAAALSLAALACAVWTAEARDFRSRVVVPAALCALITATKYNSALIGLPFLLLLARDAGSARVQRMLAFAALVAAFFLVVQPYSLLDFERFRADVAREMLHYRTGHAGHDRDAGWPQLLAYLKELHGDYGSLLTLLGVLGVAVGLRSRTWLSCVLLSFPLAMLLHMSTQRVFFPRSVLPAFAVFSIFIGLGALTVVDGVTAGARSLGARFLLPGSVRPGREVLVSVLVWALLGALLVSAGVPAKLAGRARIIQDSRLVLAGWLDANANDHCLLVHPKQLGLDPSSLPKRCRSRVFDLERATLAEALAEPRSQPRPGEARYLAYARWGHDARKKGGAATAAKWTSALHEAALGTPIWQGGAQLIWVNYATVELGDPAASLFRAP